MSFVLILDLGFPGGSDGKGSACNMGDLGLIPGSRRFLGEGNGYPFQYSCLENSMGQRSPVGYNSPWCCKESDTTERLTLFHYYSSFMDFTGSSAVKNLPASAGDIGDIFDPWVGKILWRRKWQPTPVFLPGEFHGQRSLVGYSPWGRKESDTTQHACMQ